MKKILKSLFLIFLFSPLFVNASTVSLDCPSSTKYGSEITCKIKINTSETIAGFQANVSASSGLTYKSYTKSSGWAGSSSSSKFLIYDNTATGNVTLGTYTYKVTTQGTDNLTVSLSGISVSDTDGGKISTNSSATDTIRIMSSDNTLKSLTINGVSVSNFSSSTLNYTYKTNDSSIKIAATANSSFAKISGTGTKTVDYGTNVYNIVVTAENGSKKTYKITVTKDDNRDKVNTLDSLSVEGYTISPSFNKNTLNYTLSVDSAVTKVKINATKTGTKSSFVSGNGPREVKLEYGKNTINVKVKAENDKVNTYTIIVNKKDNRSSNNNLKSLTSSIGNIEFNKDTTSYSILTDQNEITINGEVEDSNSSIDGIKTYQLKDGVNEIKVSVTAENGEVKTYIIKVTKVNDFSSLNISNNLKGLSVLKKYGIDFKKDVLEYNLSIGNEDSLELDLELEDKNATYEVKGNENLKNGSIISIIVTSIDGKSKEYKINISKDNGNDNSDNEILPTKKKENKLPIILLIISAILNVIFIILLLVKKSNNKSENIINEKSNNDLDKSVSSETNDLKEEIKEIPDEVIIEEEKKDNE